MAGGGELTEDLVEEKTTLNTIAIHTKTAHVYIYKERGAAVRKLE